MLHQKNDFFPGIAFLVLAQTLVGVNIVASKLLVADMPLFILLLMRFAIASLVLLPLHWTTPARRQSVRAHFSRLSGRDWGFLFAQAMTAGFLFNCLMLMGLHYTDANVAGIITSVLPAIIALLSWAVLREKISAETGLCVALSTAGLLIIAYAKFEGVGSTHSFFGDFIVFLALLPEASYYVLCKVYSNRLPVFLTSALLNGMNTVCLLPVLFFQHSSLSSITLASWTLLLIIGLSSGLFYVFWLVGVQQVDNILASLSTAIMPVATVILAWAFLSEKLTPLEFIGMGLVILSIFMYARR